MNVDKMKWTFSRMKAMNVFEIIWRLSQKSLTIYEKYYKKGKKIIDVNLYKQMDFKGPFKFFLEPKSAISLPLLAYEQSYHWHKGIDTQKNWPKIYSYDIPYKQCDDIGDARKNWELNRHFLFQQLAARYESNRESKYLEDLKALFYDWVDENPFQIGISWTSVMEVAIRAFSWLVVYNLLMHAKIEDQKLLQDFKTGILQMMTYVSYHQSRYSSGNNHLIIEMAILGLCGLSFGNKKWVNKSLTVLHQEMKRQNHVDGVNKEQSIHYQAFVMEGIALYIYMMKKYQMRIKPEMDALLKKMAEFVSDLMDSKGHIVEIGDNDEGKLLDIVGEKFNYYEYVLQLVGRIYGIQYGVLTNQATNLTLFSDGDVLDERLVPYDNTKTKCYKAGGHTILKYVHQQQERLMTFDHGDLGFGSIAAHGQADALSITLTVDGECVIIDPGTYIYHAQLYWRNYFRRTIHHNTIQINGKDQSEMMGPFLWGKRAKAKLLDFHTSQELDLIYAKHDGYKGVIHERCVRYLKKDTFLIEDTLIPRKRQGFNWVSTFMLNSTFVVERVSEHLIKIKSVNTSNILCFVCEPGNQWLIEEAWISKAYGQKERSKALRLKGYSEEEKKIQVFVKINEWTDMSRELIILGGKGYAK